MKTAIELQEDFERTASSKCCLAMDFSEHEIGGYISGETIQAFNLYVHGVQDGIAEAAAEYKKDIES